MYTLFFVHLLRSGKGNGQNKESFSQRAICARIMLGPNLLIHSERMWLVHLNYNNIFINVIQHAMWLKILYLAGGHYSWVAQMQIAQSPAKTHMRAANKLIKMKFGIAQPLRSCDLLIEFGLAFSICLFYAPVAFFIRLIYSIHLRLETPTWSQWRRGTNVCDLALTSNQTNSTCNSQTHLV